MRKNLKSALTILLCLVVLLLQVFSTSISSAASPSMSITNIKATTPQLVNIGWSKVSGAEKYIIYRSTSKDSGYNKIQAITGTSYNDAVYPNMTYYYKIEAIRGSKIINSSNIKNINTPRKIYNNNEKATFKNKFLEKWVRNKLGKSATATITIKELDKITEVQFVGSVEITKDVVAEIKYPAHSGNASVNGKNVVAWDFYSLDDFMQFRKLKVLTIMGQQITDVSPLANLSLESLNLGANHIADINPIGKITTLSTLALDCNPIKKISALASLKNLKFLYLSGTLTTDVSALTQLNYLNRLDLSYSSLVNTLPLGSIKELEVLNIDNMQGDDLAFLAKPNKIAYLRISKLKQNQAKHLQQARNLEFLFILNNHSGELADLSLPKLKTLFVFHSDIQKLSFVKGCSGLENLRIENCPLEDISAVGSLKNLSSLDLSQTYVTDVSALKKNTKLSEVTLPKSSQISYESIKSQVKFKPHYCESEYWYLEFNSGAPYLSEATDPKPADVVMQSPKYINIEDADTYNKQIITDELLSKKSNLPEASASKLPYWTGTNTESKITAVSSYGEPVEYWTEQDIKFLADNNLNYMRALLSFTYLSDPKNENKVNEFAVEEIDQLIAWGIKYGVHIEVSMIGLPNKWGQDNDREDIGKAGGDNYFKNEKEQLMVKRYWSMLAKRYAAISNKYLDFELYAEPKWYVVGEEKYADIAIDLANTIWQAEGNKSKEDRRILFCESVEPGLPTERIAEAGCCIALHFGGVHRYTQGNSTSGFYENFPYLPANEAWPPKYLPHYIMADDALTIRSESSFPKGTKVSIYLMNDSQASLEISSGGKVLMDQSNLTAWTKQNNKKYSVTIDEKSSEILIKNTHKNDYQRIEYYQVTIEIPGKEIIHLVPHTFAVRSVNEKQPIITIYNNGDVKSSKEITGDYLYENQILPIYQVAQKYNVGFMLGEVSEGAGTDIKYAYALQEMFLSTLYKNKISWGYTSFRDIIKPMRKNVEVKNYPSTPWFYESKLVENLKKYTGK